MKVYIRLAALLGLLIFTGCPPPEPDCVEIVHLSFDGSLFDSSANNFSVASTDTVEYAKDRFANNSGAAYLDGSATITIPSSPKLDFQSNSEYSISVWVRTRDTADASIVAKGGDAPVPGYSLQLQNGRPAAIFTGNTTPIEVKGTKSIADNIWHLLTLSVTPDSIHLYADTTLVASASGAQLAPQKNKKGPLYIGKLPNATKPFIGYLDNVVILPCGQDQEQVTATHGGQRTLRVVAMGDMPPGVSFENYNGILDVNWISDSLGYACGTQGRLFKRTSAGWNPLTSNHITPTTKLLAISFLDASNGVTLDDAGKLYVTTNGGDTWDLHVPNLVSLPAPKIYGVRYVDPNTILLYGSSDWSSGGTGFIAKMASTNGSNIQFIEPGEIGEVRMLAVVKNGTSRHLWAFGTNSEVRQYTLSGPLVVSAGSPNEGPTGPPLGSVVSPQDPNLAFQSADIIRLTGSGEFSGLVGTQNGKVLRFSHTAGSTTWADETSQFNFNSSHWVLGVRASQQGSVAIASGLVSTSPVTSVTKRTGDISLTSGQWQQQGATSATTPAVVVSTGPSNTYIIYDGMSTNPASGLPGTLLP